MKVSEAMEQLAEMPQDADLVICGHEFPGMEDRAWNITHFAPTDDGKFVLTEGAGPGGAGDGGTN